MTRTAHDINTELQQVREERKNREDTHRDLYKGRFVEKTLSHSDFVKLSTDNREKVQLLHEYENSLVQEFEALIQ